MTMIDTSTQESIRELLSEGVAGALEREKTTFDKMTEPFSRSLVLFGAGGIGRKTLAGLRRVGIEPLLFADNNPALWGKQINGVNVVPPQEACARHGKTAGFVVTMWSGEGTDRMKDRLRFLRDLGGERVVTFGPLFWKYPEVFLPHYAAESPHKVHEDADAVLEAAALWEDDASRREYESQIRWRLFLDFDGLADPALNPIYFPSDICALMANEVFVDCGAYDGDTIEGFLAQPQPGFKKIIAFEPDPSSFAKLKQKVAALPSNESIVLHEAATGAINGPVFFSADGLPSSAVGSGTTEVRCVTLDDVLADEIPTYIKMDIEGAEPDALWGARRIIEQHAPVLAICSYHRQNHVWEIPRLIHSINPGYQFFLRPQWIDVWDLVCYAIPAHRLKRAA